MTILQNFAFEEHLVRVIEIDGNPWFVGKDIAERLGYADPTNAIKQHCKGVVKRHPLQTAGGLQEVRVLSEPDVLRLIVNSRLPAAERFERWVFEEVLPQIRKTGHYLPAQAQRPAPFEADIENAPLSAKVELLRFIMRVRGRETAVAYMGRLGLPEVPALPIKAAEAKAAAESAECLAYLLDRFASGDQTVRELITEAFDDTKEARRSLTDLGIRMVASSDYGPGICIATAADAVEAIYKHSQWPNGNHCGPLRAVRGAMRWKVTRFAGGKTSQSIFIPLAALEL